MRVFAGPNGSGKSAVYKLVKRNYRIGYYINADDIEQSLSSNGFLNLDDYGIQLEKDRFETYLSASPFILKSKANGMGINLRLKENVLVGTVPKSNSYEAAFIAEMLRSELISSQLTFSFETVMSHPSKLDVINTANAANFKTYLYFVCTQNPAINISRIRNRVSKGGHPVPTEKVTERYYRSLEVLASAAMAAHRAYLFDNSGDSVQLVAELRPDKQIILQNELVPEWVERYFLDKL